ncbi:MAG: hypothetical protein O3C19_06795 [Bacteroidetes bacterium]|nr:hypothetical protein [Bacteroidota bacterium]
MSKMKEAMHDTIVRLQEQEILDESEFELIKSKQESMSKRRGYEVDFYEAKTHCLFDKIDERIATINKGLRGLPRAIGFAGEDHPDQGDFYHG